YTRNNPLRYVDPDGRDWYTYDNGLAEWWDTDPTKNENPDIAKRYQHVNIPSTGLKAINVQGATGQYESLNGHNVTFYNDPRKLEDNGVYLPVSNSSGALDFFAGDALAAFTSTPPPGNRMADEFFKSVAIDDAITAGTAGLGYGLGELIDWLVEASKA